MASVPLRIYSKLDQLYIDQMRILILETTVKIITTFFVTERSFKLRIEKKTF